MNKARVNFSGEADGNLSGPAHNIHTKMVANVATFASPPVAMPAFSDIIDAWDLALEQAQGGGIDRTTAKNNARDALEDALRKLGGYVNTIADGDLAKIELSGFPSYDTSHPQTGGGVAFVPQNLRLERTPVSGGVIAKWQGDGSRAVYELQTNTSDPNVAANWSYKGSFTGGRADLSGLTPATTLWVRVRKIGTKGETGGWSDPASIMVT
jgi:hypothetical protein